MDHARIRCTILHFCIAASLAACGCARAASFTTIDNCSDDGSPGTLRSALEALTIVDNNVVIDVSACTTITLARGELVAPVSVAILGPYEGMTTLDADHASRVIEGTGQTAETANLILTNLTLRGGRVMLTDNVASGGCIAGAAVTLNGSVVTDCLAHSDTADAIGGAINATALTLYHSRIVGNAADSGAASFGGGIATNDFTCTYSTLSLNQASGNPGTGGGAAVYATSHIDRCTIDTNAADYSGALLLLGDNFGASASTITQSTISGNQASTLDGGLFAGGPLTIANSTVTRNYAPSCAGVQVQHDVQIDSSIVAGNLAIGSGCVDLAASGTISGAHNLVGVDNGGLPAGTIVANPRLAPLADHGGFTRTHALQSTSPAVDTGSDVLALTTDQRGAGFARAAGAAADIGAYERQAADDQVFYGGFDP